MIRLIAGIVSLILGGIVGSLMSRLPIRAYWQSLSALVLGGVIASIALAASWLLWPPADVGILAVSAGLMEAGLSALFIVLLGSGLHFLMTWAASALHPAVVAYRGAVMGLVGAALAAATFAAGIGGIRPVR
jgi:hypothetical protein